MFGGSLKSCFVWYGINLSCELHVILEGSFGGNQMGSWGWGGAGNTDTSAKAPDAWNMATNWAAAPPPPPPEPTVVSKACLLMISAVISYTIL